MHHARQQPGNQNVKDGANGQRAEDANGHIFLWVLGFLRRGGDSVEADIGKENYARGPQNARPAMIAEGTGIRRDEGSPISNSLLLVSEDIGGRDADEDEHRDELDEDNRCIEIRRLLDANHQDGGNDGDADESDQIEQGGDVRKRLIVNMCGSQNGLYCSQWRPVALILHPGGAGHVAELGRQLNAIVLEEGHQRSTPSGGYGGRAEGIFQDQIPADDPGKDFSQRGVAVGIGRAGNGNKRSELGVT